MMFQPNRESLPSNPETHQETPDVKDVIRKANEEARKTRDRSKSLSGFVRRRFTPPGGWPPVKRPVTGGT
jgi:hypothetical protein